MVGEPFFAVPLLEEERKGLFFVQDAAEVAALRKRLECPQKNIDGALYVVVTEYVNI